MPLCHVKTRSKRSGHRNVRELQGSTSGHRVGPGSSVAGVIRPNYGIRSASSVSHRQDMSRYGLFHPARPSPCELFRAANWQMRRRVPSAGVPTAVLPRGAIVVEGRHKSRPLPLNKSLPRAAYRTAVRSFLLYHILNK